MVTPRVNSVLMELGLYQRQCAAMCSPKNIIDAGLADSGCSQQMIVLSRCVESMIVMREIGDIAGLAAIGHSAIVFRAIDG